MEPQQRIRGECMPKLKNAPDEAADVKMSISEAIAAYLEIETNRSTAKQCAKKMLERVREMTENPKLTMHNLKQAIADWIEKGWIILTNTVVQVMRPGRVPIRELAEQATMSSQPAATTTMPQSA